VTGVSTDDPTGYLPPHELRGLLASLSDDGTVPTAPGPSIAASSPGLATAALAPPPTAPAIPFDDPGGMSVVIAQLAGELFRGSSVVPMPMQPQAFASAAGLSNPLSPGISPQLVPSGPGAVDAHEPVAPMPTGASETPSPALAGAPTSVPGSPVPPGGGSSSAWDVPGAFGDVERLSLLGDAQPSGALAMPELFRIPVLDERHAPPARDERDAPPAQPTVTQADATPIRSAGGTLFDPYAIRKDFPILEERVHGGKRLVWLDNAATTQKPRAVIDRLTHYYEHENSNVHRAAHALAARATDAYESARETTRKFLNAPSASEIIFVRGATEGINLIAKAWGGRHVEAGDEIVLTHLEHHANIVPWQQLCAEKGARLRIAPVDDRGDVILEEYEKLFCARTRLAAFTQVSNALGTITPAREMIEIAHRHGACVVLDGAQAVSHIAVDVQQLDCDFYVFSGHKVFAPTGIGAVFGKREILEDMPPWQGGGNMITDVTFERTQYQAPPWRFEAGTGNIADAAGLGAALDYVMRIGMTTIDRYEHELLGYATERLLRVPGLRLVGTAPHKAGVLSFVLDGQRTEDVGAALDKEGIAVRSGHHCAQPILRRYGYESTVRASLAFYNIREDIDALSDALLRLQSHRRGI